MDLIILELFHAYLYANSTQWSNLDITRSWTYPLALSNIFAYCNAETTMPSSSTMASAIESRSNTQITFRGKLDGRYWNHNMSYTVIGI